MINYLFAQPSTSALIAGFEGKEFKMYLDSARKPSIGIGHLIKPGEEHLLVVTLTEEQVQALFVADIKPVVDAINRQTKVQLSQSQFDALCSFAFNLGINALLFSTLWKSLQSGVAVLEKNFTDWCKQHVNGELEVVPGILARRKKEWELFTKII